MCDLAFSLIYSKTTNFELKEFPTQPTISALYLKPHPDGDNFINSTVYIPQEMVHQPPKKHGAVSVTFVSKTTTAAAGKAKKAEAASNPEVTNNSNNQSSDGDSSASEVRATRKRTRAGDADSSNEIDPKQAKGEEFSKRYLTNFTSFHFIFRC